MEQEISTAIVNLNATMEALDKACNDEKFFNTELSFILEQMSYEALKFRNELKEIRYMYC
jgi:hypothetical protein